MSSQESRNRGRGGSPMSLRNSSGSVIAKDIALSFKNTKFSSHDIQIIKHAYHNLMKFRTHTKNTEQKIKPANKNKNKFKLIKPSLPANKFKPKIQEKLISKSSQPQKEPIAKSSQSDNQTTDVNPECSEKTPIQSCRVVLVRIPDLHNRFKLNDATTNKKLKNCAKCSDFKWPSYKNNLKETKQPGIKPQQQEPKNPAKKLSTANTPDVTKTLYNTALNTTMNNTIDNVQKVKVGNVGFRSHRVSNKKQCGNETCISETKSGIEPQKKHVILIYDNTLKRVIKQIFPPKSNPKSENNNKTTKDAIELMSVEENAMNKEKSASDLGKKTKDKRKPKSDDTKKTLNNKSKPKADAHKVDKSIRVVRNRSPKNKITKTSECNNNDVKNKKTKSSNASIKSPNLDSTVETANNTSNSRQQPMRSCRAASQNRSIEVSTSL